MDPSVHILPLRTRHDPPNQAWGASLRSRMRPWGITITDLAMALGVSRQYSWQVVYAKAPVSDRKREEVETAVEALICERRSGASFGQRLRGARLNAGLTLQAIAGQIGYSWVAIERWEKDICIPKPGVLWHLRHLYGVDEDWYPLNGATPGRSPLQHQAQG